MLLGTSRSFNLIFYSYLIVSLNIELDTILYDPNSKCLRLCAAKKVEIILSLIAALRLLSCHLKNFY